VSTDIYNDGTYASRNPLWHSQDSLWKAGHLYALLRDVLGQLGTIIRVAEIGCGYGDVLGAVCAKLASAGITCQATGYDVSQQALTEATRRHPEFRFLRRDFWEEGEPYDLGLLVDVLEHLEDPRSLLARVRAQCQWVLVHLPLDDNWLGRAMRPGAYFEYLRADRGHLHYFDRPAGLRLLQSVGLRVRQWRYTFWGVQLYRYDRRSGRSAPLVHMLRTLGMTICPGLSVKALGGASLAALCRAGSRPVSR